MTKKTTIAALNSKMDSLANSVAGQISTIRGRVGAMLGLSHDGKRDIYEIYGYPLSLAGTTGFETMYRYSGREGIANRITWGMAQSCWSDGFDIFDAPDTPEKKSTQIAQDELALLKKAGLNEKIQRADILNRIGKMSVLFVGVPDGLDTWEPIGTVAGGDALLDKLYFIPYAYDETEIHSQVNDMTSPRFGLPESYTLRRVSRGDNEKDVATTSHIVHHSRIVHFNEKALCSDIEGMGVLEPIFNRILDLDKTCGGSSEAYFRNARGKIAVEVGDQYATGMAKNDDAKKAFQENAEEFTNHNKDFIVASGSTIKAVPTPMYTPIDTVRVSLWCISGYTGIPMRILTGEGSGQLAGSEDQLAYNQLVRDRQRQRCTIWACDVIGIIQSAGLLKSLPPTFEVRFPVQEAATEFQKAENGSKKADTVLKLVQAKSELGGEGLDLTTSFSACGLEDIKIDEPELEDLTNPDEPGEPEKGSDNEQ